MNPMNLEFWTPLLLGTLCGAGLAAEDWPRWRGPRGIGVADEKNLPERCSATENVAWKVPIGGSGISTPVVAAGQVFVTSQIGGRPGKEIAPFEISWGHSSSPTLHGDLLLLLCDHELASYLLALDARTGKERWKADRGKGRASYSTPLVVETPRGAEVIVNSSERIHAYDAKTGALLWHAGGANRFPIPMPVVHDGVI